MHDGLNKEQVKGLDVWFNGRKGVKQNGSGSPNEIFTEGLQQSKKNKKQQKKLNQKAVKWLDKRIGKWLKSFFHPFHLM